MIETESSLEVLGLSLDGDSPPGVVGRPGVLSVLFPGSDGSPPGVVGRPTFPPGLVSVGVVESGESDGLDGSDGSPPGVVGRPIFPPGLVSVGVVESDELDELDESDDSPPGAAVME